MKKININLTIIILIGLLISCDNDSNLTKVYSKDINPIDTVLVLNSEEVNIKVRVESDLNESYIKRGDYDSYPDEPIEDKEEYWVNFSSLFTFTFQDKENKFGLHKAYLNMDLIKKAVNNNPELNYKLSLNESLLSGEISYLGLTSSGILMFKVNTFWGGGDGGGQEWTIGVLYNQTGWSNDYKGEKLRLPPICIMEVIDNSGNNFHYKNNKYFLGDFIGNWNYDCEFMSGIGISKEEKYISVPIASNQIYLKARYELEESKLLLFLNNESGFEFGDFGVGGASLPWEDYSREKPFAELSLIKKEKNKLKIKWLGFYNVRNKKYEDEMPEFMNIVEGKVKSDILNRCN